MSATEAPIITIPPASTILINGVMAILAQLIILVLMFIYTALVGNKSSPSPSKSSPPT